MVASHGRGADLGVAQRLPESRGEEEIIQPPAHVALPGAPHGGPKGAMGFGVHSWGLGATQWGFEPRNGILSHIMGFWVYGMGFRVVLMGFWV